MENKKTLSGLFTHDFTREIEGKVTTLYILTNHQGTEATITNFGAKIVSFMVKCNNGTFIDVVTGHPSIDEYLHSKEPSFGAICGRYANRIAKGTFEIDGIIYDQLAINNGPNSLHGGIKGFNAVVWDAKQIDTQTLALSYISIDGEEGYPGELHTTVTYHLTDDNELEITYKATTSKPTVINLTNHSYFNLSGAGNPSVADHLLEINADNYLPTDQTSIPYGPMEKVEGTPMDFRQPHTIGSRIDDDFQQLIWARGYDHTYILNKLGNELSFCAKCYSPQTGIVMETFTTEPGVQLYIGNWLSGDFEGKNGQHYPARSAFCLETQHYPDSPNQPNFPSTILRPGETFESKTIYKFSNH